MVMITKDSIEAAYCFFHQKLQIYSRSSDIRQKEDIEYAVESFTNGMNDQLYISLSEGNPHFLRDYSCFQSDLERAVFLLSGMLNDIEG